MPGIHSPSQLKNMSAEAMDELSAEIRYELIETVSKNGGHLASNLGVVELTLAMHKSFDSPKDSFVFDVGHQVYTHKLLTDRYAEFSTLRKSGGLSGFPNPEESVHDTFAAGHSGTSIAAAYGLARAKKLKGDPTYTVAVIGDGSFTGGLVYEAMNNAGNSDAKLIVVLNENEMSISKNVGAMATYLAKIRTNPQYYRFKGNIRDSMKEGSRAKKDAARIITEAKKRLKDFLYSSNFFEDMGFAYMGPIDGHDIEGLCKAFQAAKIIPQPVLLHVKTTKGKGYGYAEHHPSTFHGISKFDIDTGEPKRSGTDFSGAFSDSLCAIAEKNPKVVAVTAAMALGTGLKEFSKRFPNRFFDVGIAEEFGATFSGGLAKGGFIPVYAVYSTFLQRAYDEISHDVAMQNQKVIFAVDRAGFVGEDGRSHQGIFDMAFLRTIPKTVIYAPSSYKGLDLYLRRAVEEPGNVVAVRYPRGKEGYLTENFETTGKNFTVHGDSSDICICTFGRLFHNAVKAMEELAEEGISVRIVKLNRVWPIDPLAVEEAKKAKHILFYEEGCKSGGIGEGFAVKLLQSGYCGTYDYYAVDNTFVHHAAVDELLQEYHLDKESMKAAVKERVKTS